MVRPLLITAAAGLVLMLVCFAGAAALGGPELRNYDWFISDNHFERIERGPRAERRLEWDGTDTLTLAASVDVTFFQSDTPSVTAVGPANLLERLTLTDGRLDIEHGERSGVFTGTDRIEVRIAAPDVSRFVIEGSGDLELNAIDRETLDIRISGSGDVSGHGRTGALALVIEGSGEADLRDLAATSATVRIDGSGEADVRADETVDVEINGSGDVELHGRPGRVTQEISGSGEVSGPASAEG